MYIYCGRSEIAGIARKQVMLSADCELLGRLLYLGLREVHPTDRPMWGMRDYIVRVVLRTLAGEVPQIVYIIDFGKLADDDEAEIHALCDAVYGFIFLEAECIPFEDEWNEELAANKNVLKQGEVSGSVKAAVKAALAFRSLADGNDAMMTGTGSSGGDGCNDDRDN